MVVQDGPTGFTIGNYVHTYGPRAPCTGPVVRAVTYTQLVSHFSQPLKNSQLGRGDRRERARVPPDCMQDVRQSSLVVSRPSRADSKEAGERWNHSSEKSCWTIMPIIILKSPFQTALRGRPRPLFPARPDRRQERRADRVPREDPGQL